MTQNETLENWFKTNDRLTQRIAARDLGIWRLSERVRELERKGYVFEHKTIQVPSRHGKSARVMQYIIDRVKSAGAMLVKADNKALFGGFTA